MSYKYVGDHGDHAAIWIFSLPNKDTPTCLACIVHLMEDEERICVQKKPAVLELGQLLKYSEEAVKSMKDNMNISSHIVLVLIELLKYEDTGNSFISQVMDVCMQMVGKLESAELVTFVLNALQSELDAVEDMKTLLPIYLFIGRLVQNFPELAVVLCNDYASLLHHLCQTLAFPDEELQSAVVYIFVHLLEGDWQTFLPSHIYQQILQEVICQLNVAKLKGFVINMLGLLKKLVQKDDTIQRLLMLNFKGVTLLTVLKKLLVSRNDVFQLTSVQILSCVLSSPGSPEHCDLILQSDIIEFLFECLHTRNTTQIGNIYKCIQYLCQLEQFYTRYNSMYGIDSILRSLEILTDMKNYDLMKESLEILAAILTRQPSSVPLFVSSQSVQTYLSIITQGLQQHQPQVFTASLVALHAVIRRDHLLLPVPFKEIEMAITCASKKIWPKIKERGHQRKVSRSGLNKEVKPDESIQAYCKIHIAAAELLRVCCDDPLTCASNFSVTNKPDSSSITEFQQFLSVSVSESCIPVVLSQLEEVESRELCECFLNLVLRLHSLDPDNIADVINKFSTAGGLSFMVNMKVNFRVSNIICEEADECLLIMCKLLHEAEGITNHSFPLWNKDVFSNIKYKLRDLPSIQSLVCLGGEIRSVYLFLLYHSFKNDNLLLSGSELLDTIAMLTDGLRAKEWSPLMKKQIIFLQAVGSSLCEEQIQKNEISRQDRFIEDIVQERVEVWFTHHLAVLLWTFHNESIYRICHLQVLEAYLEQIASSVTAETGNIFLHENQEFTPVLELCHEKNFLSSLIGLFQSCTGEVLQLAVLIIQSCIDQLVEEDEKSEVVTFVRVKASEITQDLFRNIAAQSKEGNLWWILSLLLDTIKLHPSQELESVHASDIKVIYHIIKLLSQNSTVDEGLQLKCLQYLSESIKNYSQVSRNRVLSMIAQNQSFLDKLESWLQSDNSELMAFSMRIMTFLTVFASTSQDFKCCRPLDVDVESVNTVLRRDDVTLTSSYLEMMSVLFSVKFLSPILNIKHTGRFPQDVNSPFMSHDIHELFINLQQLLMQFFDQTQDSAVMCLQALFSYIQDCSPDLETELLHHPWNKFLLEILLQTSSVEGVKQDNILTVFDIFLGVEDLFQHSDKLINLLLDKLCRLDRKDFTVGNILMKMQPLVSDTTKQKYAELFQQDATPCSMEQ